MMEDHAITATGMWEVINNNHEVIMIWATTVDAWVQFQKTRDTSRGLDDTGEADERLAQWETTAASFTVSGDTHIMTPLGTVYGPDDWEEANLTAWDNRRIPETTPNRTSTAKSKEKAYSI